MIIIIIVVIVITVIVTIVIVLILVITYVLVIVLIVIVYRPEHTSVRWQANLPTKITPTKIAWLKISGKFPMHMRIPPLHIKITFESNPLKSRISVRRLAVRSRVERSIHVYSRFPKFNRVILGRDPGTLKSDIVSNKHPQLICSDLRLSIWKFEDWNYGNRP